MSRVGAAAARLLEQRGYELRKRDGPPYPDIEEDFWRLHERCAEYTMTPVEAMYATYRAAQYVVRSGVPGDIVECGVWRGGHAMLAGLVLNELGDRDRQVFLYDTFEGMVEPGDQDISFRGERAGTIWQQRRRGAASDWCYSSLEEVQANVGTTGLDTGRFHFVKGKVEETIPGTMPDRIALLRLDTDWYESTYHELRHLYPRLSKGGVLILDDYGHWAGAREATDRYFEESATPILLSRTDYTGRMGVRTG